eukprot:452176-Rhodomonas_salina.1
MSVPRRPTRRASRRSSWPSSPSRECHHLLCPERGRGENGRANAVWASKETRTELCGKHEARWETRERERRRSVNGDAS